MTFLPPFSPDSSILSSVFSPTRPKNCKNLLRKKSRNSDFIQVHWGGAYLQCYQPTFCQFYMLSSIKKLVPLHGQSWQHCLEGRWCIVLRKKTAACILLAKILSFNSQKDVLPISWSISVVERMRKNVFLPYLFHRVCPPHFQLQAQETATGHTKYLCWSMEEVE